MVAVPGLCAGCYPTAFYMPIVVNPSGQALIDIPAGRWEEGGITLLLIVLDTLCIVVDLNLCYYSISCGRQLDNYRFCCCCMQYAFW